jgi:drug/metabolite transporter (DMT)-like permease
MVDIGIIGAVSSMLVGVAGIFVMRKTSHTWGSNLGALVTVAVGLVPMLIASAFVGWGSVPSLDVLLAIVGGFFLSAGFILRYIVLKTQLATNVNITGQMQPVLIAVWGLFLFGEQLSTFKLTGMILVFIGVAMITFNGKLKLNRALLLSAIGASCWAVYWIPIAYSANTNGNWLLPMVISRLTGIIILIVFIAVTGGFEAQIRSMRKQRIALPLLLGLGIAAGLLNGTGDSTFGIVSANHLLAVGATIVSTGTLLVAILAYIFLKERLTKLQKMGLLIVVIGVFALSLA